MSQRPILIDELRNAHNGEPWHGPSRASVLADVTVDEAARRPGGDAHGIWELVLHMRGWTLEVLHRLGGGAPGIPDDGDWPVVPSPTVNAWQATLASLNDAHARLLVALRDTSETRLDEHVGVTRDAPLGTGITYAAMLHGLAQHDAYHTGQVAILKRLYRTTSAS